MTSARVSCIIPVFNGERYLGEALDSVLGQTYGSVEVVVADDGSTDGTRRVVSAYDARVRYLYQENAGEAAARNLGLGAARGEFVAFLDADDLWHSDKLECQMRRFRVRPELDLCVTQVRNFWSPDVPPPRGGLPGDPALARAVPGYGSITLLARRRLFDAVGRFDPALRHGSDTEWFLRAAEHGAAMELLPDVLVFRRLHLANQSRLLADASHREYLRIVKASLDRRRRAAATPPPYDFPGPRRGA